MSIIGRTYLERGEPVEVLIQWAASEPIGFGLDGPMDPESGRVVDGPAEKIVWLVRSKKGRSSGPRNVLIRRANGDLVVRPFRGLRKTSADA